MGGAAELRPIGSEDLPFLEMLYASTRDAELQALAGSEEQRHAFVRLQFEAQRRHYDRHFRSAQAWIISAAGVPVGRLVVDRRAEEVRVVDISLLPRYRGRGLGSQVLREVLREARQTDRPVRLHVDKRNRAKRWYARLGFLTIEDAGAHDLIEWRPHMESDHHARNADL
ncbi:MAG: GNAT family N-acetyltransferase [Myxococcales bacterium]|nr:GNAT family N-acetyltransferase [Myxococcales bacterium]